MKIYNYYIYRKQVIDQFLIRLIGTAAIVISYLLYAQWLGPEAFGLYSFMINLVAISSLFSRFGVDIIAMRKVSVLYDDSPEKIGDEIGSSILLVFLISVFFAIALSFVLVALKEAGYFSVATKQELIFSGFMVVPLSVAVTVSEIFKALRRSRQTALIRTFLIPVGTLIIFILASENSFRSVAIAWWVASMGAVVYSLFMVRKQMSFRSIAADLHHYGKLLAQGAPMLRLGLSAMVISTADVVILGVVAGTEQVGVYSAVAKIAMLGNLLLVTINSITAPRIASLFHGGDTLKLKKMLERVGRIYLIFAVAQVGVVLAVCGPLLEFLGDSYEAGFFVLMVLLAGQTINLVCGNNVSLLTMIGEERTVARVMVSSAFFYLPVAVVLSLQFGALGAAIATASTMAIWNFRLNSVARNKIGFSAASL